MKHNMRNTLLGCLLLSTPAMVNAQQQAPTPKIAVTGTVRPAGVQYATVPDNNGYSYSSGEIARYDGQKNFKEEDLKSKEVSKEIAVPKGGEIYIENSSRAIVLKTWDQPKVKVTTTIYYDGETKLTDDEWLEKVNLSLKTLGTSVKVKSGAATGGSSVVYSDAISLNGTYTRGGTGGFSNGVAVFNGNGQNIGTKSNIKRIVTVTVPAGSKLDIESKYSDVSLPAGVSDVIVEIANGSLEAENLNKLVLRSKYSNINVGDVKTAEVELANGRFSAKSIDDLDIESKYSTIEMAAAKKIALRSTNDEYEIEEAGEIRGRKTYGNLRITKLNGSLEVEGNNADVKIRKVGPSLSLIKIDDKYADIRIPLRETKNYSVEFAGAYSSVYGNFEKNAVAVEKDSKPTEDKNTKGTLSATNVAPSTITVEGRQIATTRGYLISSDRSWNDSTNPARFTAKVGDGSGLKVDIKCQNCTVDFK
jgi:hypothetical protein